MLIIYNLAEFHEKNEYYGEERDLDKIINKEEDFLDVEDAKGGLISGGNFNLVPSSKECSVYHTWAIIICSL